MLRCSCKARAGSGTVHGYDRHLKGSWWSSETVCALIVIPRERSTARESSICSCLCATVMAPVISISLSASVDFPWSTCDMMQKLRILSGGIEPASSSKSSCATLAKRCAPSPPCRWICPWYDAKARPNAWRGRYHMQSARQNGRAGASQARIAQRKGPGWHVQIMPAPGPQ